MDFTNGKGVDLVIDPIGTKNWKSSYRVLAKMGKLIIYGDQNLVKGDKLKPIVAMKEMYTMPKYKPMDLMANNPAVMGYHLGRFKGHEWKVQRSIRNLIKLVNANDLHPIIDSKFSFEDAPKAHRHIQNRKNFGKVLLDFPILN
jgi:NADPH:quinone reductase-like Zn-dependent oxidoreductase